DGDPLPHLAGVGLGGVLGLALLGHGLGAGDVPQLGCVPDAGVGVDELRLVGEADVRDDDLPVPVQAQVLDLTGELADPVVGILGAHDLGTETLMQPADLVREAGGLDLLVIEPVAIEVREADPVVLRVVAVVAVAVVGAGLVAHDGVQVADHALERGGEADLGEAVVLDQGLRNGGLPAALVAAKSYNIHTPSRMAMSRSLAMTSSAVACPR